MDSEAKIKELEEIIKQKDKRIAELEAKRIVVSNAPLFSNKTHDDYLKTKYLLKKPKT